MSNEGITVNNTRYSPESIALMASQIATLEALVEVRGHIVDDLAEQNAGLILMLERSQKWARRWKAIAKRWRKVATMPGSERREIVRLRRALKEQDECWSLVEETLNAHDDRLHRVRFMEFINPRNYIAAVLKRGI